MKLFRSFITLQQLAKWPTLKKYGCVNLSADSPQLSGHSWREQSSPPFRRKHSQTPEKFQNKILTVNSSRPKKLEVTAVLRIRICCIRNILASWIRIQDANVNQDMLKTPFCSKTKISTVNF